VRPVAREAIARRIFGESSVRYGRVSLDPIDPTFLNPFRNSALNDCFLPANLYRAKECRPAICRIRDEGNIKLRTKSFSSDIGGASRRVRL